VPEPTDAPNVLLRLPNRAENVSLVREMLNGLADALELDQTRVDDIKTAVSEACNNVVLHAYPDGPGPLTVELEINYDEIDVTVRDRGSGIQHITASEDRMGVGLAVISALADRAEFESVDDGGTAVRMEFTRPVSSSDVPDPPASGTFPDDLKLAGDVVVKVSPIGLLPGVLGRLTRAAAAGAHFSLDRFSDLYLIADEVSSHARSVADRDGVGFSLTTNSGKLALKIGPFPAGSGKRLESGQSPGASAFPLTRLVDELTVEALNGSEVWSLIVRDRRERGTEAP
jgi:anti-sigma regulatory factor (Ser/Thr protein kinase)